MNDSVERHECPKCKGQARLIQMTCTGSVYHCGCGARFTITDDTVVVCVICKDTKYVGPGEPCPHCEDRQLEQMLHTIMRY